MDENEQLRVVLFSFGFKYGSPVDANLVFDVRLLPNPYWVEELRSKTGKEKGVSDYVLLSDPGVELLQNLEPLLEFFVKQSRQASKKVIRIGIGCTGGRHRSVAVTEKLAAILGKMDLSLLVFHRDIEKDN